MTTVRATSSLALVPGARAQASAALRISLVDAVLFALMVGLAENYLDAFAVELGHGPRAFGLLRTLPVLAGVGCLFFSPLARAWLGTRKRVCVLGALGQAVSLAVLLALAVLRSASFPALLGAQLLLGMGMGLIEPAWNSWMMDLTRHVDRSRYFARRSLLLQGTLLLGFGVAGWALAGTGARLLDCYAALFAVALVARLASVVALALQAEPESVAPPIANLTLAPRLGAALARGRYQVALYLACLGLGAEIAEPFFTPYLLRELSLGYHHYTGLAALSMLAKALTFLGCPALATRLGQRRLLIGGGAGAALVPLLWASSSSLPALILAHALTGIIWAVVEFASYQLLLEDAPRDLTTEFFTLAGAMEGLSQVLGALSGGALFDAHHLSFHHVFVLSALVRAAPLMFLYLTFRRRLDIARPQAALPPGEKARECCALEGAPRRLSSCL